MKWGTVCDASWAATLSAWGLELETDYVIMYSTKWPQQVARFKEVITSGKTFVGNPLWWKFLLSLWHFCSCFVYPVHK